MNDLQSRINQPVSLWDDEACLESGARSMMDEEMKRGNMKLMWVNMYHHTGSVTISIEIGVIN